VIDPPASLDTYASVSSAFEVRSMLDVSTGSVEEVMARWPVKRLAQAYRKDYDAVAGNHPTDWSGLLHSVPMLQCGAYDDDGRVGGALVLRDAPAVELLEGRRDVALLWDIRVAPAHRGRGIGTMLFETAVMWAQSQGCRGLLVETQDTNVPACRFYAGQGCRLAAMRRHAYEMFPEEVQLLWRRTLTSAS
ncbi:MAG: GNAT family N-acetyltransferase, partial [Gemmatimonadales bacterium]